MNHPDSHRSAETFPLSVVLLTGGAIILRLLLFLGRGSYVAFDEGWYLLLGRSLWSGEGYTLSGLPHVALSPLFPLLAGAAGRVLGDPVWAGRIVTGVASGLLVLPCWSIFRRLAPRRVAFAGVLLVAVAPSLAPFVVPYWVGWDLWVGAEPLLHLLLFSGLALLLRVWEAPRAATAAACGGVFSLAYLARPEAVGTFALVGLVAMLLSLAVPLLDWARGPEVKRLISVAAAAVISFGVVAGPYWIYLHGELGRWTLTGRHVTIAPAPVRTGPRSGTGERTNRIEDMLWRGDESAYVRTLYALDPSGTRLANGYWGIQPTPDQEPLTSELPAVDGPGQAAAITEAAAPSVSAPAPGADVTDPPTASPPTDSWLRRYAAALGVVLPWYGWVFVLPGLLAPARAGARRLDLEALVAVPLAVTSVLIVRIVAIDPRTQLFLAPLAAFYAARGALWVADAITDKWAGHVRAGLPPKLLIGGLVVAMLTTSLADLTLSLTVGSPHHVVAEQNAAVGGAIRRTTPEGASVVSFHPAIALFAHRDWRVLPLEPMPRIVRYAKTQPDPVLVLSVFYPPQVRPLEEPHYLIVPVPEDTPESERWRIDVPTGATVFAFGRLEPENGATPTGGP